MAVPSKPKPATVDDLRAIDDPDRIEIVGGVIVEKAMPSPAHAHGEARLAGLLHPFDATSGEVVRAEPFDTIDLVVAELFGDEADE